MSTASCENSSEQNRGSYPTRMVGFLALLLTWSAMAVTARRTLANVKSSAIRPRQPEVPNLMGEGFGEGFMAMYSSPVIVGRKRQLRERWFGRERHARTAVPSSPDYLRNARGSETDRARRRRR